MANKSQNAEHEEALLSSTPHAAYSKQPMNIEMKFLSPTFINSKN
jgi:hypothetical protein